MRRVWVLIVTALLAAGCVGLPTTGPVQEGLERAPEPEGIVFLAPDPHPEGTPAQIVTGFLDAATAGVADRFETAQKYLTEDARRTWLPSAGVTIYSGATPPEVEEVSPGQVKVTVPVAGVLDAHGVYTEAAPGQVRTTDFRLTEIEGQWRIARLDDGVLISAVNFGTQYRQVSLAFFSPDARHIIPDPRWFPERNAASFAVSALLAGPAEWLAPGVRSAIPPGTGAAPVNVAESVAEVRLTEPALAAAPEEREMIVAQLEHTLTQLPRVRRVRTLVDEIPFTDAPHQLNPVVDPSVGYTPVVLHRGGVSLIAGTTHTPVEEFTVDEGTNYTALAVPYGELESDLPFVVRQRRGVIATLPRGEAEPEVLVEGSDLLAPSYDPAGWLWTGEKENNGTMLVTRPGSGVVSVVAAPGLAGAEVRAVRVARDGSRIAVVYRTPEADVIAVAMITADEEGTPVRLEPPHIVGRSVRDATDVAWIDAVTLAVLASSDDDVRAVHTVPLGGPSVALLSVAGAESLTSGRGEREIWVATRDGQLFNRAGNGWRRAAEDLEVEAVAFPG